MSPYIRRAKEPPRVGLPCSLPRGWFRSSGTLWECPLCGRVFRLFRGGDFAGNYKTWDLVKK